MKADIVFRKHDDVQSPIMRNNKDQNPKMPNIYVDSTGSSSLNCIKLLIVYVIRVTFKTA